MAFPLPLRCRCGWEHEFLAQQAGQRFSCPRCQRGLFVTEDPTEFLNSNVGDQDFQFSEDPTAPDESTGAIGLYRKQTAKRRTRARGAAATPRSPGRAGQRRAAGPKRVGNVILWLGLAAVVVAALAFFTHAGRTERVRRADELAERVAAGLNKLNGLQPADAYQSQELLRKLVLELQQRSEAAGGAPIVKSPLRVPSGFFSGPAECTLVLRSIGVNKDGRRVGYEVVLHCGYSRAGWRVDHYRIEDLSAAQMSGAKG